MKKMRLPLARLFAVFLIVLFLVPTVQRGWAPPVIHTVFGYVYDDTGIPVKSALVKVRIIQDMEIRESIITCTTGDGRYSVDLSNYSSGNTINVTASLGPYFGYNESIVDLADNTQQIDVVIPTKVHVVEGYVYYPNGTLVDEVTVKILDANTNSFFLTEAHSGYYKSDLVYLPSGFSIGDVLNISSKSGSFSGYNLTTVSSGQEQWIDIHLEDTAPPVLTHNPVNSASKDSDIPITAEASDDSEVSSLTLHYKNVGDGAFTSKPMLLKSGDTSAGVWGADIPLQTSTGIVYYYLEAADPYGNIRTLPVNNPDTDPFPILINDVSTPIIDHVPVTTAGVNEAVVMQARVTDDVAVSTATLYYKTAPASPFTQISMALISGNTKDGTWQAEIPARSDMGITYYYINATDGTNSITHPAINSTSEPHEINVTDINAPLIDHVPVDSAVAGEEINITAAMTDDLGVVSATLYYTDVGSLVFNKADMALVSGDDTFGTWLAKIPAQTRVGAVYYYIEALDRVNRATDPGTDPEYLPHIISINDAGTPVIGHTPVKNAPAETPIQIVALLSDDVGIEEALVMYRVNDIFLYKGVKMFLYSGTVLSGIWKAEIPAQAAGSVRYYIWVRDNTTVATHPSVNPSDNPHEIIIQGNTGLPVITHAPVNQALYNQSIRFSAIVKDDSGVQGVRLYYRGIGETAFSQLPMELVSGTTVAGRWELTLDPLGKEGDFYYYLWATDGLVNSTHPAFDPTLYPHKIVVYKEIENDKPVIHYTPIQEAYVDENITIEIDVEDDHGIRNADIYYRNVGNDSYNAVNMELSEGDPLNGTWMGTIPPQNETGHVYYFIQVYDGKHLVTSPEDPGNPHAVEVVKRGMPVYYYVVPIFLLLMVSIIMILRKIARSGRPPEEEEIPPSQEDEQLGEESPLEENEEITTPKPEENGIQKKDEPLAIKKQVENEYSPPQEEPHGDEEKFGGKGCHDSSESDD